jgi:hypothetical protein
MLERKSMAEYRPPTAPWWDNFLITHGRDSQTEKMFLGYLNTHHILPSAPADQLDAAWNAYLVFMEMSAQE